MVFVKTFVIFVPFVFQFADPATTVNEPKATRTSSSALRSLCLCVSVVNNIGAPVVDQPLDCRHWSGVRVRISRAWISFAMSLPRA